MLSPRELEVLILAADGLSIREIGERFGTTASTVKTQQERLRRKLKARSMAHALALAYAHGLIEPVPVSSGSSVPRTSDYTPVGEGSTLKS